MNKVIVSLLLLVGVYFVHEIYLGEHRVNLGPLSWDRVQEKIDSVGQKDEAELVAEEKVREVKRANFDQFRGRIQTARALVLSTESAIMQAERSLNELKKVDLQMKEQLIDEKIRFKESLVRQLNVNATQKRSELDELRKKHVELNLVYKKFGRDSANKDVIKNVENKRDKKAIARVEKEIAVAEEGLKKFSLAKDKSMRVVENEELGFVTKLQTHPPYKGILDKGQKVEKEVKAKEAEIVEFKEKLGKANDLVVHLDSLNSQANQGDVIDDKELLALEKDLGVDGKKSAEVSAVVATGEISADKVGTASESKKSDSLSAVDAMLEEVSQEVDQESKSSEEGTNKDALAPEDGVSVIE